MGNKEKEIEKLQKNLSSIRKIAGWTLEDLGNKIGVTKQTISNLENFKTKMTQTQYIAIRTILDYEIQTNKDNLILMNIVDLLLNKSDSYTEEEYDELSKKAVMIAGASTGVAATSEALLNMSTGLLGFSTNNIGKTTFMNDWLSRLFKSKKGGS